VQQCRLAEPRIAGDQNEPALFHQSVDVLHLLSDLVKCLLGVVDGNVIVPVG
jgi:hypothetical protein